MSTVPVVPGRSDVPEGFDLHATSKAHELSGRDPNFAYQYVSLDPEHPQFVEKYLKPREMGNPVAQYITCAPWEIVRKDDVVQGAKRADDTKGVDTKVTHGRLVLIRTPKANAAKEEWMTKRMTDVQSSEIAQNERRQIDQTRYGVQVFTGNGESGAHARSVVSSELTGGK